MTSCLPSALEVLNALEVCFEVGFELAKAHGKPTGVHAANIAMEHREPPPRSFH